MNDNAIHKAVEDKGIDLKECHFSFSEVNSPTGVPHNEEEFNKVIWMDHDTPPVTWAEVVSAGDTLDAEYASQAYARTRQTEYPPLTEQLDLLWHAIDTGTLDDKDHRNKFYSRLKQVKENNPKG